MKCNIINSRMIKGSRKCKIKKNRFKVAFVTANPPHSYFAICRQFASVDEAFQHTLISKTHAAATTSVI